MSYQDFADRHLHCLKKSWVCGVTGKSGLTFAEALKSEEAAQLKGKHVGEILRAPLKHIVMSFHGGNLDALVTYILEQLNERFFVGETVEIQGTAARPYKAEVLEVLAADAPSATTIPGLPPVPCNYVVQRIGKQDKQTLPSSSLKHRKLFITKETVRQYVKAHTRRASDKSWMVLDGDEDGVDEEEDAMPNIKAEMTEQQMAAQLEARKRRKLELDRKARERRREQDRIRDDIELTDSIALPIGKPMQLRLPVGDVAMVAEFVGAFWKSLHLDPADADITLPDFERELHATTGLGRVSTVVLQLLAAVVDPANGSLSARCLGMGISRVPLDCHTVSEVLRLYLLAQTLDAGMASVAGSLRWESFFMLTPAAKLRTLVFLCHQALSCAAVDAAMDDAEERIARLKGDFTVKRAKVYTRRRDLRKSLQDLKADTKSAAAEALRKEDQQLQAQLESLDSQQMAAILDVENQFRMTPLGEDRLQRKYWLFKSLRGLFIEPEFETLRTGEPEPEPEPVCDEEDDPATGPGTPASGSAAPAASAEAPVPVPAPPAEPIVDRWTVFTDVADIEVLAAALNPRGTREAALLVSLRERLPALGRFFADAPARNRRGRRKGVTKASLEIPEGPATEQSQQHFRTLLLDLQERLDVGALSTFQGKESFAAELDGAKSCKELGALLRRVEEGIAPRYLKPAVSASDDGDVKEFFLGDAQAARTGNTERVSRNLQEWRTMVDEASNLAQLFVCLYVLEASVLWVRSAQKTRCRMCHRAGEAEKMLLCDKCDGGFHMYCLTPKLRSIPEGEWFCPRCNPIVTPARRRREELEKEESEPEEEEGEEDADGDEDASGMEDAKEGGKEANESKDAQEDMDSEAESDDEGCRLCKKNTNIPKILLCDKCDGGFHMYCLKPRLSSIPTGEWFCPDCASSKRSRRASPTRKAASPAKSDASEASAKEDDENEDICGRCHRPGELLCCETCPRAFHLACCRPPLKRVPRGDWYCEHCAAKGAGGTKSSSGRKGDGKGEVKVDSKAEASDEDNGSPVRLTRKRNKDFNMELCQDMVKFLETHAEASPFLHAVSRRECPDYASIIKRPMDLETLKDNLNFLKYKTLDQFLGDVRLIVENAHEYNGELSTVGKSASAMLQSFEKKFSVGQRDAAPEKRRRG